MASTNKGSYTLYGPLYGVHDTLRAYISAPLPQDIQNTLLGIYRPKLLAMRDGNYKASTDTSSPPSWLLSLGEKKSPSTPDTVATVSTKVDSALSGTGNPPTQGINGGTIATNPSPPTTKKA